MTDDVDSVDVTEWLVVQPGDWVRAERRPHADTDCESFQGVVESVHDDHDPSPSVKMVNGIRRYWANWKLVERRPAL